MSAVTAETTWAGPWCLECARPAQDLGPSLTPGRPLVFCRWTDGNGYERGHRKIIGTWDRGEALERIERARHAKLLREHPYHRTASLVHLDCPECQKRGPHLRHVNDRKPSPDCDECKAAGDRAAPRRVGRF